jgi:hypothetical protein
MKLKDLIDTLGKFNPEIQIISSYYSGMSHSVTEPNLTLVKKGINLIDEFDTYGEGTVCDESEIVIQDLIPI